MGRIISVVASAIMVFCLLVHPLSAQQRNMTIGMTNWAENIAVANLWKILLAERGYQAELRTVDRVLAFSGLARAYRDHAPIVVTLWSPHWAFAQYDLKYLDDAENDFGGGDDNHFMSRAGFGQDFPEVLGWLNAWTMSDGELGSLMLTIERAGNAEAGARQWLAEKPAPAAGRRGG